MLETAKNHFDDDMHRARGLLSSIGVAGLSAEVQSDMLRAAWMMAVGACDAFFSDAYADLISRAIRAAELQPTAQIPERLKGLKMPVAAVLSPATNGWRWRMAARELIQTENVLSLEKIRHLFNQFCRSNHRLLNKEGLDSWILAVNSKMRLFGITPTAYRALATDKDKDNARKRAVTKLESRFQEIFQRRHDCIHNCDRPKVTPQNVSNTQVRKVIEDVEFLAKRCHSDLIAEFPLYLAGLGFSGLTRNRVGAS